MIRNDSTWRHIGIDRSRHTAKLLHLPYLLQRKSLDNIMSDSEQQRVPGTGEDEPLLGRAGDASQQDGKPLYHNFIIGKLEADLRCA